MSFYSTSIILSFVCILLMHRLVRGETHPSAVILTALVAAVPIVNLIISAAVVWWTFPIVYRGYVIKRSLR